MIDSTLVLIKNDGITGGNVGAIINRFERLGFTIDAMEMTTVSESKWRLHYSEHEGKEFFDDLIERMHNAGPVIAMIVSGDCAVMKVRAMTGPAAADMAPPGTIRGDFGTSLHRNVIHSSDSKIAAERELAIWF